MQQNTNRSGKNKDTIPSPTQKKKKKKKEQKGKLESVCSIHKAQDLNSVFLFKHLPIKLF